jgi:hypothetical protein
LSGNSTAGLYLALPEIGDWQLITADRKSYKALTGLVFVDRLVWVEGLAGLA